MTEYLSKENICMYTLAFFGVDESVLTNMLEISAHKISQTNK